VERLSVPMGAGIRGPSAWLARLGKVYDSDTAKRWLIGSKQGKGNKMLAPT